MRYKIGNSLEKLISKHFTLSSSPYHHIWQRPFSAFPIIVGNPFGHARSPCYYLNLQQPEMPPFFTRNYLNRAQTAPTVLFFSLPTCFQLISTAWLPFSLPSVVIFSPTKPHYVDQLLFCQHHLRMPLFSLIYLLGQPKFLTSSSFGRFSQLLHVQP